MRDNDLSLMYRCRRRLSLVISILPSLNLFRELCCPVLKCSQAIWKRASNSKIYINLYFISPSWSDIFSEKCSLIILMTTEVLLGLIDLAGIHREREGDGEVQ